MATPARLNDIIENHPTDIELADIEVFVLDEVDCLLSMGFEPQVINYRAGETSLKILVKPHDFDLLKTYKDIQDLLPSIPQVSKVLEMLPLGRQNLMFSATVPPAIARLGKAMMRNPISITIGEVRWLLAIGVILLHFDLSQAHLAKLSNTLSCGWRKHQRRRSCSLY